MSGVGSTNAMKKGSANNPFLAYSEADMQSFLNSAYTGCIVKYAGEPISRYLTEQNKTVPEHVKNLVFSPIDSGFWTFFDSGNIRIKIQQKTNGSTKTLYITPGRFYNGAWHFNKYDFTNGNLYLTDSLTSPTETPVAIQEYFSTEPYWRWNKECVNDQGNLIIWTHDQDVTFTIEQATTEYGIAYDSTHGITIVPYKVNELYKVVYSDGEYYYEEFYHIGDTRTTANSDYIAPGKTAFDFTGNLQTGTGSKINPYLAYTVAEFQSFPVGSFIKWLGPGKTVIDATTGQMLIHGEVYRAVEDGDILQYVILPTLTNEATAEDVAAGKEFINGNGQKVVGTKLFIGSFDKTSWFDIRNIVLSGKASDYWKAGDTKTITSKSGRIYNIRLTDLQTNRYIYSDGSGSSKAVFEFVECYSLNNESLWPMNGIVTNGGGWASSEMRSQTMPIILADLPDDMVEVMSQVKVLSGTGDNSTSGTSSSDNKLFLPAEIEIFSRAQYSIGLEESPLGQFDYYKANNRDSARIKNRPSESMALGYWVRSPRKDNFGDFMLINNYGAIQTRQSDNRTCISPIFTI